jgi:hypothetical protein
MDDGGARLSGRDSGEGHQSVVTDHLPVVDGNRRQQLTRREGSHQVPRPVKVGVHIAQVVVLIEELGDRLGILRRSRPHLDRAGRLFARACEAWGSLDVVPPRVSIAAAHACVDVRRHALPVRTEVKELNVPGGRCEGGERLR